MISLFRRKIILFFFLVFLLNLHSASSQEINSYFYLKPDYVAIDVGEEVSINVGLYADIEEGQKITGFGFGLCHDPDILEITSFRCSQCHGIICLDSPDCCTENVMISLERNGIRGGFPIFGGISKDIDWLIFCVNYRGKIIGKSELQFCTSGSPLSFTHIVIDGKSYVRMNNLPGKIIVGDVDNDGLIKNDNCPEVFNPGQKDIDNDKIGDACDSFIEAPFIRGDANNDAKIDIGDPIFILNYLFQDGKEPQCMDTADTNDDSRIDISDAVYLLYNLFENKEIPEPFPEKGNDPTKDDLTCEGYDKT